MFTAFFAVLAGYVFYGTWSLSSCPIMPDSPMTFPEGSSAARFFRRWMENGLFYPYNITVFLGSPYFWQELQYVIGSYFSALALAYFLMGRGLSRAASYGAGLLLGFCGYWFTLFSAGHGTWFHWMIFGVFVFGLIDRAVRKNKLKNWVLLGATLAWGAFTQIDMWLLFSVFSLAYFIRCCIREKKLPPVKGMLAAAVVFIAVGTPAFISAFTAAAGRDSQIEESRGTALSGGENVKDDKEARWIFVTNWSLPPAETLEFLLPRINGDTSCAMVLGMGGAQGTGVRPYTGELGRPAGATSGNYRQHSLYVGFVTCLLALFSVFWAFTRGGAAIRREILFFASSAFLFWLLSLGRYCPFVYKAVFTLPFGDYLRAPVKWHHLTEFSLCVLAGFGLEGLRRFLFSMDGMARRFSGYALVLLVIFGACDLARHSRFYLAAVDLSFVRGPNAAAEKIRKSGGGTVLDASGGGYFVEKSFTERGIKLTKDFADPDVRFVWGTLERLNDKAFSAWLKKKKAVTAGIYTMTRKGIKASDGKSANAALLFVPSVPQPPPAQEPPLPGFTFVTLLGSVSLVATLAASVYAIRKS